MADFRYAGPMGLGPLPHVDSGTLARAASALPGHFGYDDPFIEWVRRELRRGLWHGVQWAEKRLVDAVVQELVNMREDLDAKLRYIAQLPESIRKEVAYEFFAWFFTHYLPRKFLRHYVWGHGADLSLTKQEMIDCNPYVNLQRSKGFQALLDQAEKTPNRPVPLDLRVPSATLTNGTLGQFTVFAKGTLVADGTGGWRASGSMSFYDEWDFDPKDFATGGRSTLGEIKTRVANVALPGTGFKIRSELVPFAQDQNDMSVQWEGGQPKAELDRISALDAVLTSPEQK
jgi:hypothetical protein